MRFVDRVEEIDWDTRPGTIPLGQTLVDDPEFEMDTEIRNGD